MRKEEMEQGSSLCPLLNMEPHLLDKVLDYLTCDKMAKVSATGSPLLRDKVGEYLHLQTSSNILDPIMVSFESLVGGLVTLPEREELEMVRAIGQERDRKALYRVMMARRHWEKVLHRCGVCNPRL